ncbi:MAG: hypothetical protein K2M15_05920 [Oscillospiraceae bacterium]|nr:hypothetical protein [Oscillospiraceae bacterium]MDE7171816.1 hypothetical protein [Oscillospiraceae bacterium]
MNDKVELSWLLQQIAALQSDTEYLKGAFAHLAQMSVGGKTAPYEPEDVAGKAKAEALGDIVRCRETTNQQLLRLYEKMYDDCVQGSRRQVDAEFITGLRNKMPALEETETTEN